MRYTIKFRFFDAAGMAGADRFGLSDPSGIISNLLYTPTMDISGIMDNSGVMAPRQALTKTWDGSSGSFYSAAHWSPAGAPQAGDTAIVGAGIVSAVNGSLRDITLEIGSTSASQRPTLLASNEILGPVQVYQPISGPPILQYHTTYAEIRVTNNVVAARGINVGTTDITGRGVPGNLLMQFGSGGRLDLAGGLLAQAGSSVTITGPANSGLVNNSTIAEVGANIDVYIGVHGHGTFTLDESKFFASSLTFHGGVAAGEQVDVDVGSLYLAKPLEFLGSISETVAGRVVLDNTVATSASYANGILTILDDHSVVAALHINNVGWSGFSVNRSGHDTVITAAQPGARVDMQTQNDIIAIPIGHGT